MCSAQSHLLEGLGVRDAPRRRAVARARPVNSEGRHDRSASDVRGGRAADGVAPRPQPRGDGPPRRRAAGVPPDDRLTAELPVVRGAAPPHLRDPIDAVKAALDGTPSPPKQPPPAPPRRPPGGGGPPRGGPPPAPKPSFRQQINWKLARRVLYAAVAVLVVLPIVTFAMAYLIVDVPKPGDIRTNQVSTILASDGRELAKIVPPEGNRVDVNIDQIPLHVRNAVMAAEDRDFYSNPGFSFTGFARAFKNNILAATCRAARRSPSSTSRTRWSATRAQVSAASSARPRSLSSRRRCPASGRKTKCCSRI